MNHIFKLVQVIGVLRNAELALYGAAYLKEQVEQVD